MNEYEPFQAWMFDDSDVDDRWIVFVVDHLDYDVIRGRVIAASRCTRNDGPGEWICFQRNSWIDQHSKRIT